MQATGNLFKKSSAPGDKTRIIIYQKGSLIGVPMILVNGKEINHLIAEAYIQHDTNPGPIELTVQKGQFQWNAKPLKTKWIAKRGETYYFKLSIEPVKRDLTMTVLGALSGNRYYNTRLAPVKEQGAEFDLASHKRILDSDKRTKTSNPNAPYTAF